MTEYRIVTPISESDIRKLKVGDIVYISGRIFGIRDATQRRIFDEGIEPPVELRGYPCLHTAPGVRKVGDKYYKVCIGTTTSTRMEKYTPRLIERYGVRAIIGKAGVLEASVRAMREYGAVYLSVVGGAAALTTQQIEEIEAVWWEDLFPECLWLFRVKEFGPLLVSVDSHGENLYDRVKQASFQRLKEMFPE